jgi:hypothetical protein
MLFARFLAENNLLIEPDLSVSISLEDCQEFARETGEDWLALASRYAQAMLPQIFRADDPVLGVVLPRETRSQLEDLLKRLPSEIFHADDSLGWVYQFWQVEQKEAINRAGEKIGVDELPAVTQLFTEDYMVWFLLHNTLGAWWAGKVLASSSLPNSPGTTEQQLRDACRVGGIDWKFLRFVRGASNISGNGQASAGAWRPAAGTFDGWPSSARDITVLDPCAGSGHFLVFALPILAAIRAAEEGLSEAAAIDAVLRDNLYGMELDPRCTQIAAFNLALAAWRRVGYRQLPAMHLACSGLSLGVSKNEWLTLAERAAVDLSSPRNVVGTTESLFSDANRRGFERLYDLFAQAPVLGSLIQPAGSGDLIESSFQELEPLLARVLTKTDSAEISEMAVAAQGLAKAARILAGKFTLVATNVPYLGRGKQDVMLRKYCDVAHAGARADLATCFIERCHVFCKTGGSAAVVAPQNWLFLPAYKHVRKQLLSDQEINVVARLGANAFQNMNFWAATTALSISTRRSPDPSHTFWAFDASSEKDREAKSAILQGVAEAWNAEVSQAGQLRNPDWRITMEPPSEHPLLGTLAITPQGLKTGDDPRFRRCFWEVPVPGTRWRFFYGAPDRTKPIDGSSYVIDFAHGLEEFARPQGQSAWGRRGFILKLMGQVTAAHYFGEMFDSNVTALVPQDESDLPALWAFVSSTEFPKLLRSIEQSVKVNNATISKVACDIAHWRNVAAGAFPQGLPCPRSGDPTQWLHDGDPNGSEDPLHVAVARLVGYRWPKQESVSFLDSPAIGPDVLGTHSAADGIVPLSPVLGEASAADRLLNLLSHAFGQQWAASRLTSLLAAVSAEGKSVEEWLRDDFFEQHCARFHQRPFILHVWDGRIDGFSALVNYHRLVAGNGEGKRVLSKLIYSFLGDWIDRQRADQKVGVEGADGRVVAANHLKCELENILLGQPPYDIFVRWKPLSDQAIGWEPDTNSGVRMNIRPFVIAKPFNCHNRDACILRTTPKLGWEKDRGKEVERPRDEYPWLWGWDGTSIDFLGSDKFDGNRWNDLHYKHEPKVAARVRQRKQ